ncbi:MAG: hypothetical protein PHC39_04590 [Proteiniphilum sp.]|nr:hypothetical protein [Proteiniphilum sp.]
MMRYTVDEKAMLVGIALSALVSGVGIFLLMGAPTTTDTHSFIWMMITGSMLFNAGVCGVTSVGSMWVNYQAVL